VVIALLAALLIIITLLLIIITLLLIIITLLLIIITLLLVVATLALDGEVYTIVERAVLGDTNETRLVVRARHDGAQSVDTSRQARDVSGQLSILSRRIETLEEREDLWVQRGGRGLIRHRLNDHVAVADDDSIFINGLRRRIVLGVGIGEEPSMEVVDRQPQREWLTVRQA